MTVAIAFSTKERVELSKQSILPLLHNDELDVFWTDGSSSDEGRKLPFEYGIPAESWIHTDIKGGADAAIVFNLTVMLNHPANYTHIGLVENDVLLDSNWFEPTMALFEAGAANGLRVGAVSARAYEDRILIQRDDYAIMHNLGAGMVIFTREAAEIVLKYCRTGHTLENRRAFMQACGLDIGQTSLFCRDPHMTCMDWQFERILIQHGLVALAVPESRCAMIGQVPPLEEQGLHLTTGSVDKLRNEFAFYELAERTQYIRSNMLSLPKSIAMRQDDGSETYLPHQIQYLGGAYKGDWRLRWAQALGPFIWRAADVATINIPVSGGCAIMLSGGESGGGVQISDTASGFMTALTLDPEGDNGAVFQLQVPAGVSYRNIVVKATTPGICFYGVSCRDPQPIVLDTAFNHFMLPPV